MAGGESLHILQVLEIVDWFKISKRLLQKHKEVDFFHANNATKFQYLFRYMFRAILWLKNDVKNTQRLIYIILKKN
jgi:hypothetical protein